MVHFGGDKDTEKPTIIQGMQVSKYFQRRALLHSIMDCAHEFNPD